MVVHVRLRVRAASGAERELVVLANGGAHSPEPVLAVDEVLAGELGLRGGEVVEVSTADATRRARLLRDAAEVVLLGEGGEELARLRVHVVVHPGLEEPIITDSTIDALGIQVVSFSRGLWRHASDPPGVVRASARERCLAGGGPQDPRYQRVDERESSEREGASR